MRHMAQYRRPDGLEEALTLLSAGPGEGFRIVAGGTDHYPARVAPGPVADMLDISGIAGLRGIDIGTEAIRVGATTTWTDILESNLPPAFDGLKAAAREVGGVQIQNRGTVAGNLCNASPAADGIPPLLALNASVELRSERGTRMLPLGDFLTGYRQTARAPDELVTAIVLPRPADGARGGFLKLGARHYLVISIAMVSGVLVPDADGRVATAAVAVGACSAVAQRLPSLEAALIGAPIAPGLGMGLSPAHFDGLSPIDDARASADYRRDAARILVGRLLEGLARAPEREAAA